MKKEDKIVELAAKIFRDRINTVSSFNDKMLHASAEQAFTASKIFYSKVKDDDAEVLQLITKEELMEELEKIHEESANVKLDDAIIEDKIKVHFEKLKETVSVENEIHLEVKEDLLKKIATVEEDVVTEPYLTSEVQQNAVESELDKLVKNKKPVKSALKKVKAEDDSKND